MNTNIPLFRAKKMDSDEYVIGYLLDDNVIGKFANHPLLDNKFSTIDPLTLSIHFPDNIASDSDRLLPNGEQDLRIFTSLSEDGTGGDFIRFEHFNKNENKCGDYFACYIERNIAIRSSDGDNFWMGSTSLKSIKIIGIKQ